MKIELIDQNWLIKLESLFSESYQEQIEIQDELDYFLEVQPQNWFIAIDNFNNPVGFIRCFSYSNNNRFQVELFADKQETELSLINEFDKCNSNSNKQIRFCLNKGKSTTINYLKQIGYSFRIEEFQTHVLPKSEEKRRDSSIRIGINRSDEIAQIVKILCQFGEISNSKVIDWISEKKLIICENQNIIVAAALIDYLEHYIEIVELAVSEDFRRKGYARKLINGIAAMYTDKKLKLKVNKENIAAIALYQKCGFIESVDQKQIWLTKQY